MTNNVMSSSSPNTFDFNFLWLLMTNHFFVFIRDKMLENPFANIVQDQFKNSNPTIGHHDKFKFRDGLLYYSELLYVLDGPTWLQLLQVRHNVLAMGHFKFNKTIELMSCDYWWPQMWKYVKEFVGSCDVCVCAKNPCHWPHGFFQLLPIPPSPWSSISMDIITNLSPFDSFDSILAMVDHLTKMIHFIPNVIK